MLVRLSRTFKTCFQSIILYPDQIVLDAYLDLKWDTFNSFKMAEPRWRFYGFGFRQQNQQYDVIMTSNYVIASIKLYPDVGSGEYIMYISRGILMAVS